MLSFRGGPNPSTRLADDLTPLAAASDGGVFCHETLDLPAGPHVLRLQVQLPTGNVASTLELTATTVEGAILARAELDTSDPRAAEQADALTLGFMLTGPTTVVVRGTASSHASLTHLRFLTQAAIPSSEGQEAVFRFHPDLEDLDLSLKTVVIGTTAICNANCFHCPTNKAYSRTQARGVMEQALFERIVTELADLGFNGGFALGLFGEPLQDPLLPERMRFLRSRFPDAVITTSTNAALYDPAKHREALAMTDDVAVHIEGVSSAVYEASMRPLKTSRTFPRAERLIEDRAGAPVHIVAPLHRRNLAEAVALRDLWEGKGAGRTDFVPLANRAGQGAAFDDVALAPLATGCGPDILTHLIIDWDGAVLACCQDFHRRVVLGDLSRESVRQFLAGAARRRMAEQLNDKRWNAIETCRGCKNDCQSSLDAHMAGRLRDSDARRRFQPREFRTSGAADLRGDVIRVSGRRPILRRLGRPRVEAVVFGPYKPLSPGRYRVDFDLSAIEAEPGARMKLDVTTPDGALAVHRLEGAALKGAMQLEIEVTDYVPLEFRVWARGVSFDFRGVAAIRLES